MCLEDEGLLANLVCVDSDGVSTYDFTTLEGTLKKSYKNCTSCNGTTWTYVIQYDEDLLAAPGTPLTAADISGVFCEGCLTTWVKDQVGSEIYLRDNDDGTLTLVTQHGCEYTFSGGGLVANCCSDASETTVQETVTVTTADTVLLAANTNRKGGQLRVRPSAGGYVYVNYGGVATTADFEFGPGDYIPIFPEGTRYTGAINAIAASGTVDVDVVEL